MFCITHRSSFIVKKSLRLAPWRGKNYCGYEDRLPLRAPCPTRACDSTRCARFAAPLALGLLGAAAGTATLDERLRELAKLHLRFVGLGQLSGVRLQLGRH